MCLRLKNKKQKKPLIAKKDIPVFKKLKITLPYVGEQKCVYKTEGDQIIVTVPAVKRTARLLSPIMGSVYNINKEKTVVIGPITCISHPYINNGLHAFVSKRTNRYRRTVGIAFKAIVPKGSKYYLGEDGDIVSNRLIIKGIHNPKDLNKL